VPTLVPYRPLPLDQADVVYAHGPDSAPRRGATPGTTVELDLVDSATYPGTTRKVWVHVPAGYRREHPAGLVVFNDGWWCLDPTGQVRGAVVLDNLVHRGDIPMVLGIFVDPGVIVDAEQPKNRNVEYDAFDDRYLTFLRREVLPLVSARWAIIGNPGLRVICGGSSGGNAAFTAAWKGPDLFGGALCFLSSFAQMPGGNPYPDLLGQTEPKALRIFLQAGHRDLGWDKPRRNWLAENLRTAAALAEAGYDFRLGLGDGGHSPNHEGVLLPDALRWILRSGEGARGLEAVP